MIQIQNTPSTIVDSEEISVDTESQLGKQQDIIVASEQAFESTIENNPEPERPTVKNTVLQEEISIIKDSTPIIQPITEKHDNTTKHLNISDNTVRLTDKIAVVSIFNQKSKTERYVDETS